MIKKQRQFQLALNIPINTLDEQKKYELSEIFLFKAIEEIIELRKEFPSVLNKHSKTQKEPIRERVMSELSDVLFFLINFSLLWKVTPANLLKYMSEVQKNNFKKINKK